MSYILYINGYRIDVETARVAYTKQANDIAKLSDRQASYTNSLRALRTANNTRAFQNLGLVRSNSNIPYQRSSADLFDGDTGECLIYKGWAVINQTNTGDYDINIYDGIIDFYKAVENKSLSQIGISDLNHLKNLDNVVATWASDWAQPYRYMIADYNGKLYYDGNTLNVDYFIPAALVEYLWERVHEYFGFTYTGDIFQMEAFKNLWMTYPKPIGSTEQELDVIHSYSYSSPITISTSSTSPDGFTISYFDLYLPSLLMECFTHDAAQSVGTHCQDVIINETGLYQFKFNGFINFPAGPVFGVENPVFGIALARIVAGQPTVTEMILDDITASTQINLSYNFNANAGEKIALVMMWSGIGWGTTSLTYGPTTGTLSIVFARVLGENVSFEDALIDFKITDFFSEVLNHFGLTPFKDRFSTNIRYLTLAERMQIENVQDWSDKFPEKLNTEYEFGNYGQESVFRYKYNADDASYNDGKFSVPNKNLDDVEVVYQSKLYTIEKEKTLIGGVPLNIYKFWNKEVKDNGEINYKGLENRYYFIRSKAHHFSVPITVGSEVFDQSTTISNAVVESYYNLRMQEVVNAYYALMAGLLNKAKIEAAQFYLSPREVANVDMASLLYVKQWASYYFLNKIQNFVKGKSTRCELIEVDYFDEYDDGEVINNGTYIDIEEITVDICEATIAFVTDANLPTAIRIVGAINLWGGSPQSPNDTFEMVVYPTGNVIVITLPRPGFWNIRLYLDVFGNAVASEVTGFAALACPEPEPPACEHPTGVSISSVQRANANYPNPGDQGSQWTIMWGVQGADSAALCGYSYKITIVSSVGTQVFTQSMLWFTGATIINFIGRPTSAVVTLEYTDDSGLVLTDSHNYP